MREQPNIGGEESLMPRWRQDVRVKSKRQKVELTEQLGITERLGTNMLALVAMWLPP